MTPSGPPIYDREQAIKTVTELCYLNPEHSRQSARTLAEQIVDALGIGQPDPEGKLWAQALVQETASHESTKYALGDALDRVVRAEERLRAVETVGRKLLDTLSSYVGLAVPLKGEEQLFHAAEDRVYGDSAALRAVLPVEQEGQ